MRLTTVILIASLMQVSAATFGQRITINQNDAPLTSIFKEIRRQSGYDFYYNSKDIPKTQKVDIAVSNVTLEEALKIALKGSSLNYEIGGKIITIKKKEESIIDQIVARFQAIDVRGTVVDEKGQVLPGATVKVKSSGKVVLTDVKGEFYVPNVKEDDVLVITYTGYLAREVNTNGDLSAVRLELSNSKLDEVQVIAYGTTTRRLSTGNVGSINAKEIERQPVSNPLLALQGRIPGLQVTQSTGFSGGGVKVLIHGQNSLYSGNDPFYVIDGIPYISQMLPNLGDILGNSRSAGYSELSNGNPLNFINPSDIESIDVLKDADATAIYGSRAANGAILITTKSGKAGKVKFDFNISNGFGEVANKLNLLNTDQYLSMRRAGFANDGVNLNVAPYNQDLFKALLYPDIAVYDQNRYTDWQEELIGGRARFLDTKATLSGGNENTNFLVGMGFKRQTTVFPGDNSDIKGSTHFNFNHMSVNGKLKLSMSGSYLVDDNKIFSTDLTGLAMRLAPNAPSMYNADGSINWATASGYSSWYPGHPLAYLEGKYRAKTDNLISNLSLGYELLPGLNAKGVFGFNSMLYDEVQLNPITIFPPERLPSAQRIARFGTNKTNSFNIEPQLSYVKNTAIGRFEAMAGTTIQQRVSTRKLLEARGFNSDLVMEDIKAATSIQVPDNGTLDNHYKYNAYFGRINYNINDKYILNLSGRRDGTSRFGKNNRFHNFGAIGTAWIFSNLAFVKKIPALSFGKLRASYGTTGSDQIGDYRYLNQYIIVKPDIPYQGTNGLTPDGIPNYNLQWEETAKLNLGLDLGLFNDKVLINATYFDNRTSNQLMGLPLPQTTGTTLLTYNLPAKIQNKGWELAFSVNPLPETSMVKWSLGFNVTIPKNKLLKFDDIEALGYSTSLTVGQPVTSTLLYRYRGINSETGIYEFIDRNGNSTSTPDLADRVLFGTAPKFYGGLTNNISSHGFSLDFSFQFVKQIGDNNLYTYSAGSFSNQLVDVLDSWRNPGDNSQFQKFTANRIAEPQNANEVMKFSDAAYTDASFIKLKNVSLSWDLPEKLTNRIRVQRLRLIVQGQNLVTMTKYKGLDPESLSNYNLPPLRMLTLGIQLTF